MPTRTKIATTHSITLIAGVLLALLADTTLAPAPAPPECQRIHVESVAPAGSSLTVTDSIGHLCDYRHGSLCEPCATCPQGKSGYLCCDGGVCVETTIDMACRGIKRWRAAGC